MNLAVDRPGQDIPGLDRPVHILMHAERPRLYLLGDVLSLDECATLITMGLRNLAAATVVDNDSMTGGSLAMEVRTSWNAFLGRGETPLVAAVEHRLAAICGYPYLNGESMQILRYKPGEEYQAHFDWFDPEMPGHGPHLDRGGQRVCTFLLYLNDVPDGGGTHFPKAGITIQPRAGNAALFWNVLPDGTPDRMAMHAGLPPTAGVKYVASKWVHKEVFV